MNKFKIILRNVAKRTHRMFLALASIMNLVFSFIKRIWQKTRKLRRFFLWASAISFWILLSFIFIIIEIVSWESNDKGYEEPYHRYRWNEIGIEELRTPQLLGFITQVDLPSFESDRIYTDRNPKYGSIDILYHEFILQKPLSEKQMYEMTHASSVDTCYILSEPYFVVSLYEEYEPASSRIFYEATVLECNLSDEGYEPLPILIYIDSTRKHIKVDYSGLLRVDKSGWDTSDVLRMIVYYQELEEKFKNNR